MTCRIDRVVGDGEVILDISGRIRKRDLDTLRAALEAEAGAVAISLENVELVDREVVSYLARKEINGTVLRDCSPYIREWVTRDRTEMLKASGDIEDA
jgi:hypothetical protein